MLHLPHSSLILLEFWTRHKAWRSFDAQTYLKLNPHGHPVCIFIFRFKYTSSAVTIPIVLHRVIHLSSFQYGVNTDTGAKNRLKMNRSKIALTVPMINICFPSETCVHVCNHQIYCSLCRRKYVLFRYGLSYSTGEN